MAFSPSSDFQSRTRRHRVADGLLYECGAGTRDRRGSRPVSTPTCRPSRAGGCPMTVSQTRMAVGNWYCVALVAASASCSDAGAASRQVCAQRHAGRSELQFSRPVDRRGACRDAAARPTQLRVVAGSRRAARMPRDELRRWRETVSLDEFRAHQGASSIARGCRLGLQHQLQG